ncbi:MAG: hypothetical protein FGM32_09055 [Candidatus Kapabacteria bacterium]|nr:hypothetical protein [Candidatus Kapabacteria bacterium]
MLFFIGLALILLHEMDAMRCHEWRIFPGLSQLSEHAGFYLFMMLHIPLFIVIFSNLDSPAFRRGFDIFLIIHLGLHLLFLRHPKNEFKDWLSWSIIAGAALFGAADYLSIPR